MERPGSRGSAVSRSGLRSGLRSSAGSTGTNYGGVGMKANISVADRPVTQHGVGGIRIGTAGPRRQVQDASYFVGLLRNRTSEISSEIKKLKKETERFKSENSSYMKYERQYEDLIKLVRNLEGKLADFNLSMDKARDSTDPEDVRAYQQQLAHRNQQEKKHIDAIFLERQRCEREIAEYDERLQKLRQMEEYKVSQLSENDRRRYNQLSQENLALLRALQSRRTELDSVLKRIKQGEAALGNDYIREEFRTLSKQWESIEQQRQVLEVELEESKLNPAEARARLLDKVKKDNQRVQDIQREIEEVQRENEARRKQASELQSEIERFRDVPANDSQRHDELAQRDREITTFLESFEDQTLSELEEQKRAQRMVVGLLEHLSLDMIHADELEDPFEESKDSESLSSFRRKSEESNASSREQMQQELQKHRAELEKIENLDAKIGNELSMIDQRKDTMKSEIKRFANVDELRNEADQRKELLLERRTEYQKRKDAMKTQASILKKGYDRQKASLAANETAQMIEGLEQKLRHYEQNIFHLNEFIIEKELETEFEREREECGRVIDELNALHIQIASNPAFQA